MHAHDNAQRLLAVAASVATASEIKALWLEYEDCTSAEARMVKDLDKMEMIVQADEYERGKEGILSCSGYLRTALLRNEGSRLRHSVLLVLECPETRVCPVVLLLKFERHVLV